MLDIRTILLGKIKPGNAKTYDELFNKNLIANESINNFVTLGNYDSIMVYDTIDYSSVLKDTHESGCDILSCFAEEKRILTKFYEKGQTRENKLYRSTTLYMLYMSLTIWNVLINFGAIRKTVLPLR